MRVLLRQHQRQHIDLYLHKERPGESTLGGICILICLALPFDLCEART